MSLGIGSAPVKLEITRRERAFGGLVFGSVGAYEWVHGWVHGAVDPALRLNRVIALLDDAPRDTEGKVAYRSEFVILKPVDLQCGNRRLLYDVLNRGEQKALSCFNEVPREANLKATVPVGNGFLMRYGYTVAWSAWQGDVDEHPLLMRANFPVARRPDGPIVAQSREEFILDKVDVTVVGQLTYPADTLDPAKARLSVRRDNRAPEQILPNEAWRYLSPKRIEIQYPVGFDAGAIFEFVYAARDPIVLGLGLASMRDVVSHLRYAPCSTQQDAALLADETGAPAIDHVFAFGTSQSGRLLRDFLWQGFNEDLAGRRVFDGMLIDGAGSRKSFVNAAFGQPGRFSRQHEDHTFPGDDFPFTYAVRQDTASARVDGILKLCEESDTCPKIIHTDSSSEYWQARAALVTSDLNGADFDLPSTVRAYLFSSLQHAGAHARAVPFCRYPINTLNDGPLHRALLSALESWVVRGASPPESRVPRTSDGTLVAYQPQSASGFPSIPGVGYPSYANELSDWDHAAVPPRARGRFTYQPRVPKCDQDGNDLAGIRLPAIAAPLGTHTGWNLRRAGFAEGELASVRGSFFPFAETPEARHRTADPRRSLSERYPGRGAYVRYVADAAHRLCDEGLLLAEDVPRAIAAAMRASTAIPVAEARVPIPTRRDLAPGDRDIYDDFEKVRKVPPSVIHRTLANAPSLLRAYMRISNELRYGTQLPGRIRELAIVAVGEVTGSIYEVTAHARFALQAGAQPEQLDELCHASASTVYDEIERAAVLYAAEITQHYRAGEGTLASLNARFDPVGKVELVLQVGFYNTVVRILGAFAIESNEAVHGASFRSNDARTPIERTAPSRHGADTLGSGEHPEAPLFAAMKAAPALARCYFDFGQAIVEDRAVSPALRELVTIIVLDVLDARAMATCHRARAETLGVSRDKLQSLASFATSAHFDESEHAALRFAVESTRHIHVAAETFRDLYRSFDLHSITALTLLVAYYAGLALIAKTLIPEQA